MISLRCLWQYTFLRDHIREMMVTDQLTGELLGIEELRQDGEDPWAALGRFFHPTEEQCGPRYIDIPFLGINPDGSPTCDKLAALHDIITRSCPCRPTISLITGATGSGKTTACIGTVFDIIEGKGVFAESSSCPLARSDPGHSHRPQPRLAAWVRDFSNVEGSLWWEIRESATRRQCRPGYMPSTVFFLRLGSGSAIVEHHDRRSSSNTVELCKPARVPT